MTFAVRPMGFALPAGGGTKTDWKYWRIQITQTTGGAVAFVNIAEIEFVDPDADPISLTGASFSASSTYSSNVAGNAFDGSTATAWESYEAAPQWIQAQFASAVAVGAVRFWLDAGSSLNWPKQGKILGSDDGTNFTEVAEFDFTPQAGWNEYLVVVEGDYEPPGLPGYLYWRFYATAHAGTNTTVREIRLRDADSNLISTSGATKSASSTGAGSSVNNAFDGNTTRAWWPQPPDSNADWMQLQFASAVSPASVEIYRPTGAGTATATGFDVAASNDGSNWTTIKSGITLAAGADAFQSFSLT